MKHKIRKPLTRRRIDHVFNCLQFPIKGLLFNRQTELLFLISFSLTVSYDLDL